MRKGSQRALLIIVTFFVLLSCALGYVYWRTPIGGVFAYLFVSEKPIAGTISLYEFEGAASESSIRFLLYKPPGYDVSETRYPTIYHLHGAAPIPPDLMLAVMRRDLNWLAYALEKSVDAGEIESALIIAPYDGSGISMWSDGKNSVLAETALILDTIPYVDSQFRTIALRSSRAIQGISMGGFGAIKNTLKFPELFSVCANYDGAVHDWETLTTERPHIAQQVFGSDKSYFESYSPWHLAADHHSGLIECRSNVGLLKEYNLKLRVLLSEHKIKHVYTETSCAHDMACLIKQSGQETFAFIGDAWRRNQLE